MALAELEADRLRGLEDRIEQWQQLVLAAAENETIDPALIGRVNETIERLVTLDGELHEEDFDPRALAELRGLIIRLIGIVAEFDPARANDQLDGALITLEAMRHIVRDTLDWHVHGVVDDSAAVVSAIYAALPTTRRVDIAELAGVSPRHLQRLARGEGDAPRQLKLLARLVALLTRAWSEEGVVAWMHRARSDLGGAAPAELIGDPASEYSLLTAARQGRAQHG